MVKKKWEVCKWCIQSINLTEDKYVLLGTYSIKPLDESYFHFECLRSWYATKVDERARNIVSGMQEKALGAFEGIKEKFGNFEGSEQLQSMLSLNLEPSVQKAIELKEEEKDKKDGRRKPNKRKRGS